MTDENTDNDDEMREFVQHVFESGEDVRHESVGEPTGLTREALLRQNELAGWGEVTVPGKVELDVDGIPFKVGPSTTEVIHRGTAVTPKQLADLDLTPEQVPNIHIVDDPEERQNP